MRTSSRSPAFVAVLLLALSLPAASYGREPAAFPDVRPARVPVTEPVAQPAAPARGDATRYSPLVDQLVASVSWERLMSRIAQLSGAAPVTVGGVRETLFTRYTYSPQSVVAARWIEGEFERLGYQTELQWFNTQGTLVPNVIAVKPGVANPREIYVMGAHYDSRSQTPMTLAPGANDNGSGTAVVMEAARVFASATTEATVKFVAFTGEEQGMLGSTYFVEQAVAAGDSIAGAIILDMISWWDTSYAIQVEGGTPWEWLQDVMAASCANYTSLGTIKTYYSWGSDHVPFQDAGYPAFLAIENEWDSYSCYHRTCDTFALQRGDISGDVTRGAVGALASLARVTSETAVSAPGTQAAPVPAAATLSLAISPNPVAASAAVEFTLPSPGRATLRLLDVRGREVARIADQELSAGPHRVRWAVPPETASGVYYLALATPAGETVRRVVVAR